MVESLILFELSHLVLCIDVYIPISINILYRYLVQYIFLVSLAELLASRQHSAHLMASYSAGSLWKEIYIFETEENIVEEKSVHGQDKQRDSNYSGEKMYTDRTNKVTAIIVDKKSVHGQDKQRENCNYKFCILDVLAYFILNRLWCNSFTTYQ